MRGSPGLWSGTGGRDGSRVSGSMSTDAQPNDRRIQIAQTEIADQKKSKLQKYGELVVGKATVGPLVLYELVMLFSSWVPGALGLFLRSKLYPLLLGGCGRNVTFGQNVVLRHPHKIQIGNDGIVGDHVPLDPQGPGHKGN